MLKYPNLPIDPQHEVIAKLLQAWSAACGVLGAFVLIHTFGWRAYAFYWTIIALHALPALLFRSRAILWLVHLGFYAYFATERNQRFIMVQYDQRYF